MAYFSAWFCVFFAIFLADALLDDVQDLTIAGPAFARSAGASVGGLAYGAGDDVDRIVYDITLANGYLV